MKLFLFLLSLVSISSLSAQFVARIDTSHSGQYKRFNFSPAVYHREFSSQTLPVLRINPGDTVSTESVDALGFDKSGVKVAERGNPLTGPFYVNGAVPGDVIAITIVKLSLNRDYATTLNAFVPRSLPKTTIKKTWREAKLVRWKLDIDAQTGSLEKPDSNLHSLTIPLDPFLGGVGVAPEGTKGISTSASGNYGGNLDFKYVKESATLFLPVYHEGALLFLGDGHAAQGDGELNGDALETSMSFVFTTKVIKGSSMRLPYPRVEDPLRIMAFGMGKNLDDALVNATSHLLDWLQADYGLSFKEASQVIGPAIEYCIPKIGATHVEMVAMLKKSVLSGLKKNKL